MRILIALLLSVASLLAGNSRAASSGAKKTVHVRQYTRKDGTVVRAHVRAAPGTAHKISMKAPVQRAHAVVPPHISAVPRQPITARPMPSGATGRSTAQKRALST